MVGARLVEAVRRRDPDAARTGLTVLGAEPRPAYNRVLLSTALSGSTDPVPLHAPGWLEANAVHVHTGVAAAAVDRDARVVYADDGSVHGYDELVLATGSAAVLPPVDGLAEADGMPSAGVSAFRDAQDCDRIRAGATPGARIAVVGGGLLGVEAARGLVGRGVAVTLVHPASHLMERLLDPEAGAVLATALRALGIDVRCGVAAKAWDPRCGLDCDDGTRVAADAVVVAAGVRAQDGLAADAGLAVDGAVGGIVVDDRLATTDGRVHAIGDCARHPGTGGGLVQSGWEQAEVLADLLTGSDPSARYRGTRPVTRLKARGIDLAVLGDVGTRDGEERLRFSDPHRARYATLVLRDDRVTGAILLGLPDAAATITGLYDSGEPAPSDRLALMLGRALPGTAGEAADPVRLPGSAVICRCTTVTKNALVTAWREGATDPEALSRRTRAGTGCGGCRDAVAGICAWLEDADPHGSSGAR